MILVPNSSDVAHTDADAFVRAIQKQIDGDFSPHWCTGVTLQYVGDSKTVEPKPGDRVVRLVPSSSEPGTLGSHWLASGVPTGEVGVQTCRAESVDVAQCLSHEILEMLVDPYATLAFQLGRFFLAAEVCDRVEGSDNGYRIDGVMVENFSLPSAFNGGPGPYDFRKTLQTNALSPNGYQLQVDIGSGQWSQLTSKLARHSKKKAGVGSRRALRMRRAGADPRSLVIA